MPFTRVNPGDLIQAQNLDQVIDSLNGVSGKGVPIAQTSVNDATNYALTVQNDEATNSRALNVLKSDGSVLIRADVTGVTLGAPLNPTAGSIQTAALANNAVTNAKLGTDTARQTLLCDGGFEVWQRGNGPFTGNSTYGPDRWLLSIGAGSTLSVQRAAGNNSPYSAGVTYTHSNQTQLIQKIEDLGQLKGRTVTFAADIFASAANAIRVLVWDAVSGLNYSAYHPGGSVWQRLSSSVTVAPSATQLQVYVEFDASVSGNIDNAMLVVGSVPADYAPMHPADDLARCLRYYEVAGQSGTSLVWSHYGAAGGLIQSPVFYKAIKPVVPTVTKIGTWTVSNCAQPVVGGASGVDVTYVQTTVTALGGAQFYSASANSISIEANP